MQAFAEACDGVFATFSEVADSIKTPRIKPVRPVTTFRGVLSLGNAEISGTALQISVERYPRTKQAKVPAATKFSAPAETRALVAQASQKASGDDNDIATHRVVPSKAYKLADGMELENASQLERGYSYGRSIVVISRADEDFLRFETVAGLEIIGFVEATVHQRYLYMSESSTIVAQRGNDEANLALSALVHALFESDLVALARFVKKDNVPPSIVLLAPSIQPDIESLIEVALPFAEDMRQYNFQPLDRVTTAKGTVVKNHRYLPGDDLLAEMGNLMDSMSLDELSTKNGIATDCLRPEETYNYGAHRIMQAIFHRAFQGSSKQLPPASSILLAGSKVPSTITDRKNFTEKVEALKAAAHLKVVPVRPKGRKKGATNTEPAKDDLDIESLLEQGQEEPKAEPESDQNKSKNVETLGRNDPLRDFEAMMRNDDLIDQAFAQIQPVIEDLLEYSLGDQNYEVARSLLQAFERHCTEQEETELFETFWESLKVQLKKQNRSDFISTFRP